MQDYPAAKYPELMHKKGRPYTCLLIESHADYYICVPFRSSIGHKNAFFCTNTIRSKEAKSGLDYSKAVIIKDTDYFDLSRPATVDQDEYVEMMVNLPVIVRETEGYVDSYINHIKGIASMHPRAFERKYRYSALTYFHDIMGI